MQSNPHSSSRARYFARAFYAFIICAALAPAQASFAQADKVAQEIHDAQLKPIFVTSRVFQIKAKRGAYQDLSGQVFKMKTAKLTEYENWINAFKKAYPGFDAAML